MEERKRNEGRTFQAEGTAWHIKEQKSSLELLEYMAQDRLMAGNKFGEVDKSQIRGSPML